MNSSLYAALLSLTEIGLGSTLHALHIPFTGFFLSLNQIAILSHAQSTIRTTPLEISTIAAILKTLSPVGKKLTPMVALTMQGALFNMGMLLGGRVVGAILASLWGFIQQVLILVLFFGENFWIAFDRVVPLVSFLIGLKCVLAIGIAWYAPRLPLHSFERFIRPVALPRRTQKNIYFAALRDLLRPLFLGSLAIVIVTFYCMDMSSEVLVWAVLRPLASGYLFFILLRIIPIDKLVAWIERQGETRLSRMLKEAITYVQEPQLHRHMQVNPHSPECSSDQT